MYNERFWVNLVIYIVVSSVFAHFRSYAASFLSKMQNPLDRLLVQFQEKIDRQGCHRAGIGNCEIFQGKARQSDGYCYLTYTFLKTVTTCTVARAKYCILNRTSPLDIPAGFDVSHICHNHRCLEANHLVLEPHAVNARRKMCVTGQQCIGHGDYPPCRLEFRLQGEYHGLKKKNELKKEHRPGGSCGLVDHPADA